MKTYFIVAIVLLSLGLNLSAQDRDAYADYQAKEFVAQSGLKLPYRVLYPENYDKTVKYPVILFLHGAGERGTDNKAQLVHGGAMFTNPVNRQKYSCIALFPQCPPDMWWSGKLGSTDASDAGKAAKELLDDYLKNESVDKNRIYVAGLSMGGRGSFYMIETYPDIFAAAVPICGWANENKLKNMAGKVSVRIFHGDADNVVSVETSRSAYKALVKAKGDVEYIEYPAVGHDSWSYAFREADFFEWIFSKSKK